MLPLHDALDFLRLAVSCTDEETVLLVMEAETQEVLTSWERNSLTEHADLGRKARRGYAQPEDECRGGVE